MTARTALMILICSSVVATLLLPGAGSSTSQSAATASPVSHIAADEPRIIEDSMHEFMEYVFQPTYRRLKVSMGNEPADNAAWKAIKSDALILAESCNLLFSRTPDENGADWNQHAAASREAGAALYKSAGKKEFEAAKADWKMMLSSCNACHKQFEEGKHILTP